MKTDVIHVSGKGSQTSAALELVDKVAAYKDLSPKNALHLRLLTEEMMGMMRSITGETDGTFWIEDDDSVYQLHLRVSTRMNSTKRAQLLSASTSGKNESARGLMGRLRNFFDLQADEDVAACAGPLVSGIYEESGASPLDYEWSMLRYEEELAARMRNQGDEETREAWDELEKSVVAHVADDVKVSIRNHTVEMTILKKIA